LSTLKQYKTFTQKCPKLNIDNNNVPVKKFTANIAPIQCFPTFFQARHTFLESLTRRHTAFMTLILSTCTCTKLTYDV